MVDINDSVILGFKYSENQENVTLSPPKGDRKVAFLRLVGESFQWFRIPEPHHDSNKLYACFRGLPIETTVELNLEDLGLDEDGFNVTGESCNGAQSIDFIGAGWMKTLEDGANSPLLLAYGEKDKQTWHVTKIKDYSVEVGEVVATFAKRQKCDIIIPFVQPKRVVSEKGVYFVG